MQTIKIRYCGGCNPDYDRTRLAEKIQEALAGQCRFIFGKDAPGADRIVILHGCPTACTETDPGEAKFTTHIQSPQEAEAFIQEVLLCGA